ncbi:helicase-related protein [Sphaerisporangium corydalis]|uniref:Helicase-related protein n=1 Tax=Sphaerisporangium corydalis TaxID=1441875 RepID=A0ABV9EBM8_9ACTN|nr:helicase-related protein [Sphaerisporangium corydalis]
MSASPHSQFPTAAVAHAQRHDAMLGCLSQRIVDQAVGLSIPIGTRLLDQPHRRLWLGMLASEPKLIAETNAGYRGLQITPPAQGFSFRVATLPDILTVEVSAAAYLALHPTLEEQISVDKFNSVDLSGKDSNTNDSGKTRGASTNDANILRTNAMTSATSRARGYKLAHVWTKIAIEPVRINAALPAGGARSMRVGEPEIAGAFRAAIARRAGELFRQRRTGTPNGAFPRDDDLVDERTWASYSARNLIRADDISPPEHRAAIEIDIMSVDGLFEIFVAVVNTSPAPIHQLIDGVRPYEEEYLDTRLFEVELTATGATEVIPYELEQVAQSHRYERSVDAFGHASPVSCKQENGHTTLRTLFAAEESTSRGYPRKFSKGRDGREGEIDTYFDSLISDPVGIVSKLVEMLQIWVDDHWSSAELNVLHQTRGWNVTARKEAEEDAQAAREEVEWVKAGLEVLRSNEAVRDAFVAANRVVKAAAQGDYSLWHPFQVAWIVGCLPGMVNPREHNKVNIVWFQTGGGKSEAYLGLMLVTLFYGRYTGVTAGTQVWARFPLRLLAMQQTERFAKMVFNAEVVRQDDPRISGTAAFGIGYFVGDGNTPNKLHKPGSLFQGPDPSSPKTAEACRVLSKCPLCNEPVDVRWDDASHTMRHICNNRFCRLRGVLPVWGVDDDIYRRAPSVLVGTVDKLAQLGQNQAFQVLLGRPHSRCPKHGYSANPTWCSVFGCKEERYPIPPGFGHIRLEIADELHLLDESLGALDGMYESLLQTISEHLKNEPLQIVAATATIEGYHKQVAHLYEREAHRFPVNGPEPGETFWSTIRVDIPMRRYLGVRSRASTMVTATREIAMVHAQWVRDLCERPDVVVAEAGLNANDARLIKEAQLAGEDLYEVLVAYCLRNEDLTSLTRDHAVQEILTSEDNLVTINGDADAETVRKAVDRLIHPPSDNSSRVKIIAATKAIGHGFDVARLGVMAVMGTPTQAAEIIQASARVGRSHPGLVVNVINPSRDRDASVFRYYPEWIRYLDRLVHKVPVNRQSVPVLKRVLPGGLMAWLLQVLDRKWITGGRRRKSLADSTSFRDAVNNGDINRELLISLLRRGFYIDDTNVYHRMHREAIDTWVDDQLTALPLRAESGKRLPDLLRPSVPRSLRDIEEPLTIYGDV